jgi:hypothetical protein
LNLQQKYNTQDLAAAGARPKAKSKPKAKSISKAASKVFAKAFVCVSVCCLFFVCFLFYFVLICFWFVFCFFAFVDLVCQDGGGDAEPLAPGAGLPDDEGAPPGEPTHDAADDATRGLCLFC